MKRTLTVFLSLTLALCLALGACGKESPDTTSKEDSIETQSEEKSAEASAEISKEASAETSSEVSTEVSNEISTEISVETSNDVSNEPDTEISDETNFEESREEASATPEPATGRSLSFKAKYVSTGYDSSKTQPYAVVIDSSAELTSYYLSNKNACGLGEDYKKAISAYNVEFFETKTLIMVACMEGSGSIRHEVSNAVLIDYDSRKWLNLEIKRLSPEIGTADEAGWHIIVELDKECLEAKDNIAINMIEA